jgi:hypothetical protein
LTTVRWLDDGPHALETERDGTLTLRRFQGAWYLEAGDGSQHY